LRFLEQPVSPKRRPGVQSRRCQSAEVEIEVDTVDAAGFGFDIGCDEVDVLDVLDAERKVDENEDLEVGVYRMRLDPWVEHYSCDEEHGHGSCCCVLVQVAGEVIEKPEQLHDAVGGSERNPAGDRRVCCLSSVGEDLSWVAAHGIQEEVFEGNLDCEQVGVEHEDHCAAAEDCGS
jgi:hypothetical protein